MLSWYKHCDRAQRGWLDGRDGRTQTSSTSPLRPAHRADSETASRDLRSGEGLISVDGPSEPRLKTGHSNTKNPTARPAEEDAQAQGLGRRIIAGPMNGNDCN